MPARTGHVLVALVALLTFCALAGDALAATVSGTVKGGQGYRVVLVQADGHARQATIAASGSFRLTTGKLARATLHLVRRRRLVLRPRGAARRRQPGTTARSRARRASSSGRSRSRRATRSRSRHARGASTRARRTPSRQGRAGPSGPARSAWCAPARSPAIAAPAATSTATDVVGAFDIDDNGNRILDNVDQTRRGETRPSAGPRASAPGVSRRDPSPPTRLRVLRSSTSSPTSGCRAVGATRTCASTPTSRASPTSTRWPRSTCPAPCPLHAGHGGRHAGAGRHRRRARRPGQLLHRRAHGRRRRLPADGARPLRAGSRPGHTGALLDLVAAVGRGGDAVVCRAPCRPRSAPATSSSRSARTARGTRPCSTSSSPPSRRSRRTSSTPTSRRRRWSTTPAASPPTARSSPCRPARRRSR